MTTKKESPTKAPESMEPAPGHKNATPAPGEAEKGNAQSSQPSTSTAVKGTHGKNIGRPKIRFEALKTVPTRCPAQIYTYLKGISPFLYGSLTEMFEDMMTKFMLERPWEHGLHWRKPKTATTFANGETGKTGWEQVNMQLPPSLAEQVTKTATECGISNAAFCYTAIFWWVQYIYPPEKMIPKR
jgi:hypothetical protein